MSLAGVRHREASSARRAEPHSRRPALWSSCGRRSPVRESRSSGTRDIASVLELQRRRRRPGSPTRPFKLSGGGRALHSWITSAPPGNSWPGSPSRWPGAHDRSLVFVPSMFPRCDFVVFPHVKVGRMRECTCPLWFLSGGVLEGVGVADSSHSCGQGWSLNERVWRHLRGKLPLPRPFQRRAGSSPCANTPNWSGVAHAKRCLGEGRTGLFMG